MPPAPQSTTANAGNARKAVLPARPWWQALAAKTAMASAVFCLVIAAGLLWNLAGYRAASDPLTSHELVSKKAELVRTPQNDALKQEIRTLDLRLRAAHDRYLTLLQRSQWLLFGGMAVLLASLQATVWRQKIARPGKEKKPAGWEAREVWQSSLAVAALGVGVAVGALGLIGATPTGLRPDDATSTSPGAAASPTNAPPAPVVAAAPPLPSHDEFLRQWPRFRGPRGDGVSAFTNAPLSWNTETGEGVLWKAAVPLFAPSSPVLWGNRIFLTGGGQGRHEVFCFDANSGQLLWRKPVGAVVNKPADEQGESGSTASCTPATDGRYVFALFGTADFAAFDFAGNAIWSRNLGKFENQYGHASSPIPHRNTLLLQVDQGEAEANKSKILALDSATGKTLWESAPRPVGSSWTTPVIANTGPREELITAANPWLISYDPAGGAELWRARVLGGEMTPSPTFGAGLVFAAIDAEKLSAVRPDGTGDVTTNKVVWQTDEGLPDIVSPLCDGQRVYLVAGSGLVTCFEALTGKKLWEKELETEVQASLSIAGDRVYAFTKEGKCVVLQAANEARELAHSQIGEQVQASPAFADGRLYVRGATNLFCFGVKAP